MNFQYCLYTAIKELSAIESALDEFVDYETGEISDEFIEQERLIKQTIKNNLYSAFAFIKNNQIFLNNIEAEINRLKIEKEKVEKRIDYVKNIALEAMKELNEDKITTAQFSAKITRSKAIEVDEDFDINKIPEEYVRIIPEKRELDKLKAKNGILQGVNIKGVKIVERENIVIK